MSARLISLAARAARQGSAGSLAQHATFACALGPQQLQPFSSNSYEETRHVWRPPVGTLPRQVRSLAWNRSPLSSRTSRPPP